MILHVQKLGGVDFDFDPDQTRNAFGNWAQPRITYHGLRAIQSGKASDGWWASSPDAGELRGHATENAAIKAAMDAHNRNALPTTGLLPIASGDGFVPREDGNDPVEASEFIAKREDVKPSEGEKKYGNVKYADEKNKKYPIDTDEHIRAAWSYINHPENANKYSEEDAAAIKSHIKSEAKKHGIQIESDK